MQNLRPRRRASAHRLSVLLAGVAIIAYVGAFATEIFGADAFDPGLLFAAHVLVVGLALTAATLEWRRERLAESVTLAAILIGVVLTLVDITNGFWFFAPFLAMMTLLAALALAQRYMTRDERRHMPPARVL